MNADRPALAPTAHTDHPVRECLVMVVAVFALFALLATWRGAGGSGARLADLLIPLLLLWAPILWLLREKRDPAEYGLTFVGWRRGLAWGLGAAVVVLPVFMLGYWLWWSVRTGHAIAWNFGLVLLYQPFAQLLVTALPEEVFFRGYVQGQLARVRSSGVWPIFAAASLFALAHFITDPRLIRLAVFFPGLLFGWLRVRSGSLIAPIILHALANTAVFVLEGKV